MAVADSHSSHDDHHDHGEFIAHHFDSAEQQFDSGKLGIWIFLVTEVLFFSGLFVAYTLYRNHHPEIFDQAHVYLDKYLGGLNTIVLLFSSLTMALGVRAAQLGKNKNCAVYILATMVCAAVFLGVKAVEYSHKWDMGIFVRSQFHLTGVHAHPETGIGQALHISDYLVYISVIPALLLVGFLVASALAKMTNKGTLATFMAGMAITVGGYFLGAVGGHVYMQVTEGGTGGSHAANQPMMLHAATTLTAYSPELLTQEAQESHEGKSGGEGSHDHAAGEDHGHEGDEHHGDSASDVDPNKGLDRDIGIFFSIYYCMTGLHAIHIIAGIAALAWVFWRSLLGHWRSDYFGPVDYVGLYWHLVDLIWIYLFPLLYLID
jgi:cytochrome c oxidase subunit 3